MASIAGARRTQASFPAFLASTNPSDLTLAVFPPDIGSGGYSAGLTRSIRQLPNVKRVESWVEPLAVPLGQKGTPETQTRSDLTVVGSVDGLSFQVDRPGSCRGANGRSGQDQRVRDDGCGRTARSLARGPSGALRLLHRSAGHLADVRNGRRAHRRFEWTPNLSAWSSSVTDVVQDEVDRYPTFALFTPALTKTLVARNMTFATYYGIQTEDGNRKVVAVERDIRERRSRPETHVQDHVTSLVTAKAERAIKPESIALGAFGVIACSWPSPSGARRSPVCSARARTNSRCSERSVPVRWMRWWGGWREPLVRQSSEPLSQ